MLKKNRGIILTIESLLAALFLFGSLVIIANLSATAESAKPTSIYILRNYASDALEAGVHNGAWEEFLASKQDGKIRGMIGGLPPAVCMQAEIYADGRNAQNLTYAYVPPNCSKGIGSEEAQGWLAIANFTNSSNYTFWWVRTRAYARG